MIVLRSPKGWTGPSQIDGLKVEGFWRSHQVPLSGLAKNPEHLALLEQWLRSYEPEKLFDETGRLIPELRELNPQGTRRMSANPSANGGLITRDLIMPDFRDFGIPCEKPGTTEHEKHQTAGRIPARGHAAQPDQFPRLRPR
jgi:xylulose-5-phosphate/fructose-6-phosphate phosphoketolase